HPEGAEVGTPPPRAVLGERLPVASARVHEDVVLLPAERTVVGHTSILRVDYHPGREDDAMRFQGKVALISAAGAGIGRATAMIIGREGGTVVGVDVEQGALDRLTAGAGAAGARALALRADALDATAVEGVVGRAVDAYGRIDILVNAVGGST